MKSFWKTVLAVIVGLVIVSVLSLMLMSGFVSALSSGEAEVQKITDACIIKVDKHAEAKEKDIMTI